MKKNPVVKVKFNSNLTSDKEASKESTLTTSETIKNPTIKTNEDALLFCNKGDASRC